MKLINESALCPIAHACALYVNQLPAEVLSAPRNVIKSSKMRWQIQWGMKISIQNSDLKIS